MNQETKRIQPPGMMSFIPFLLWVILIFVLLTLPAKDFAGVGMNIPYLDKLVHMGLFGGLVFFFGLAYLKQPFAFSKKKLISMVVISGSYGIAMEFVQKYFAKHGRSFSYDDMLADIVGAVIGYFVIRFIINRYQALQNKTA